MENATKGLIIAGSILIAIILIGFGVYIIGGTDSIKEQAGSSMDAYAIQAFNSDFLAYDGPITAREAKELVSKVRTNNVTNKDHEIILEGTTSGFQAGTTYTVTLLYTVGGAVGEEKADAEQTGYIRRIYIKAP